MKAKNRLVEDGRPLDEGTVLDELKLWARASKSPEKPKQKEGEK